MVFIRLVLKNSLPIKINCISWYARRKQVTESEQTVKCAKRLKERENIKVKSTYSLNS